LAGATMLTSGPPMKPLVLFILILLFVFSGYAESRSVSIGALP
jgi:hypothetical protein